HSVKNCPKAETGTAVDVCYHCGSADHTTKVCPTPSKTFSFATCFVCGGQGHLSSACQKNDKGLYPNGGGCKYCGSTLHLMKDCKPTKNKDLEATVGTVDAHQGGDDDDVFVALRRQQVDKERRGAEPKRPAAKQPKKVFAPTFDGTLIMMRSLFGFGKPEDSTLTAPAAGEKSPSDSAVSQVDVPAVAPIFEIADATTGSAQVATPLSDEEKLVFDRIKADIPELIKNLPAVEPETQKYVDMEMPLDIEGWLSDECIARYVRARKGVYEDTKRALRKTIEWRAATRPHALRPDAVEIENRTGKMYFNGFDKMARPIIYMYNHRQNTKDADSQIRWVVYTMEIGIRHMRPDVEKVILAVDATHWSFSNSVSIGTARKFLDTLANHYPERLGHAIIFNPPKFFVAFYSLLSPFVDPATRAKVAFVKPDAPALEEPAANAEAEADTPAPPAVPVAASNSPWIALERHFERDLLEVDCYGRWQFQYNHTLYWEAVEAEFVQHKADMLQRTAIASASSS
ncbi:hypothetical protein LPJ60_005165, partial [Coemansia sp. RSA 2675]